MGAAILNDRQRKACQELVKAGDGDQSGACLRAGYKNGPGLRVLASRLFSQPHVKEYLAELRRPAVEEAQLTLVSHLRDLQELRDAAKAAAQYGPAVTAEISRGKASGLYVEKHNFSGAVEFKGTIEVIKHG